MKDLASVKLAIAVGGLIVLACVCGTLLPQGSDAQNYIRSKPDSAGLMKFLSSLGLTDIFNAWWFIILLVFFSLNITACLIRRLSYRVKTGRMGTSGWGFLLTHASMLLILAGGVIRGVIGQKGELDIREGQTSAHFLTSRGPIKLPFDVRLVDFDLEYYDEEPPKPSCCPEQDTLSIVWPDRRIQTQLVVEAGSSLIIHPADEAPTLSNSFQVVVSRYVPDFVIDMATREVSSRSDEPRNPAILVGIEGLDARISRWLFANHPDFDMLHSASDGEMKGQPTLRYSSAGSARLKDAKKRSKRIRSFKSALQLLENGNVVREKTIEVNSPISYRGYTLYQSGYNPEDLTQSTLQVARDPGVPVVYTGFLCMIAGTILLLCFKPAARKSAPEEQGGNSP